MKLAKSFHINADLLVNGMLHRYGIIIAGMYMLQIIRTDR